MPHTEERPGVGPEHGRRPGSDTLMNSSFDWLSGQGEPPGGRRRSPRHPAVPRWASPARPEGGRTRESTARPLNANRAQGGGS
jgi:hypothetical protein